MDNYRIVEYDHSYAESVADMWNSSSENWGGYDTELTARDIIEEHENSSHINVYLALDGNKVIGYCSFSEYKEDEGALYIPLLNVRPDYHGKKVGKALVLKAVNRTIELGWPRLDLYTWPGNTKAVPLYKKCGFFWEKRDDTTHLMNFIPTVIHTEAIKEYFNNIDWYQDSKRAIRVEPDGEKINDFSHYRYVWEKKGEYLKVEFERRGRGIRLIETNDLLISAEVEDYQLVFGKEYEIKYNIINKSGKELNIELSGKNDKNIKFSFEKKIKVIGKQTITGTFYVNEIKEKQNHWRTHPSVTTEIYINGKKAVFKLGIEPKFPVGLNLVLPEHEIFSGEESTCYLDIENGYKERVEVELNLINTDNIKFKDSSLFISLNPMEKRSLKLQYILSKYHFYREDILIKIKLKNEEFRYRREITAPFRGRDTHFSGENQGEWVLCNGNYMATLSKINNEIKVYTIKKEEERVYFMYPRFGKPFTLEFSKKRADKVEFFQEKDQIGLKAWYKSREYDGLNFISILILHSDGILENYYEVENNGFDTEKEIWVSQNIYYKLVDALFPTNDGIIKIKGTDSMYIGSWDLDSVSENWFFNQGDVTWGLAWPEDSQLISHEWYFSIDTKLGTIKKGEVKRSGSVYLARNVYRNWQDFRSFALKNTNPPLFKQRDKFDIEINGGNPFIKGKFRVRMKEYRKSNLAGVIDISSEKNGFKAIRKELNRQNSGKEINLEVLYGNNVLRDQLIIEVDTNSKSFSKKKTIFNIQGENKITKSRGKEKGLDTYIVDNGIVKMKVAPEFSAALYSIEYNGNQWLDSSFPEAGPRSWWSPWSGGIITRPDKLKNVTLQDSAREAKFVSIKDNYGTTWSGISSNILISGNKDFDGLEIKQYFLLLPGLPLILVTAEVIQNTGYYLNRKFITEVFLTTDQHIKDSLFINKDGENELVKYKAGRVEYEIESKASQFYGGTNRNEGIQIYHTGDDPIIGMTNIDILGCYIINRVFAPDRTRNFLPPTFLIFNESSIADRCLLDLKNISFK